jgi:hypothetical protein
MEEEEKASAWWAKLWLGLLTQKSWMGLGLIGCKMKRPSPLFGKKTDKSMCTTLSLYLFSNLFTVNLL